MPDKSNGYEAISPAPGRSIGPSIVRKWAKRLQPGASILRHRDVGMEFRFRRYCPRRDSQFTAWTRRKRWSRTYPETGFIQRRFQFRRYTLCMCTRLTFVVIAVLSASTVSGQAGKQVESSESHVRSRLDQFRVLVMTNGTSERVEKYEITAERVRYLSSERHEWEEIPYSLVDWSATEKYAKEAASKREVRIRQSTEDEAKERAKEEADIPLISPGLRLPDRGGVLLLDTFQGRPELNQLDQSGANVNKNTGDNILRAVINPVASSRRTIELEGQRAQVQSHVGVPDIYVALDSVGDTPATYTPETAKDHFRIVRCEEKKGKRIVGIVNIAIYGKAKRDVAYIETQVKPLSRRWVKVTPRVPLERGEYALVELLGHDGINTFVWDFGVDSSAPGNANSRKPEPVPDNYPPPVLQKRRSPARP